ncbi:MAG: GxxExxY protein [Ignavibacteriaceae bacterium]
MIKNNYLHSEITDLIIKAFYIVYNKLGYGFLERVYENAMMIELTRVGLKAEKQKLLKVFYDEFEVGAYFADITVNDSVIVKLKAAEAICQEHEAQLVNYLKATDIEVGLLLNFGKEPKFRRRVLTSEFKNHKRS